MNICELHKEFPGKYCFLCGGQAEAKKDRETPPKKIFQRGRKKPVQEIIQDDLDVFGDF